MPSTVIASFSYNAKAHILVITFTSGVVYAYKNVPEQVYIDMKAAFSKGVYFNDHIKGKYSFEKLEL